MANFLKHATILPLLSLAASALAHHSVAGVDFDVELTLEGTVTRFEYVNPHSWLHVAVAGSDGSPAEWRFELDSPVRLGALGVSADYWRPGDSVIVKAHPLRGEREAAYLVGALTRDGRSFGDTEGIVDPAE